MSCIVGCIWPTLAGFSHTVGMFCCLLLRQMMQAAFPVQCDTEDTCTLSQVCCTLMKVESRGRSGVCLPRQSYKSADTKLGNSASVGYFV
jgi:hypothetical protein